MVAEDSKSNADAELSNYKARRLERLESLQGGEEGLFTETFPRLEHRTETMSVSDFLEANNDIETPDNNASAVTLYGMLLLSCAVVHVVKLSNSARIGRIQSLRRHGKYFVFVDIVNQFNTIQGMINWSKVSENSDITKKQFRLFARMLERGDHICKLCPPFPCPRSLGRRFAI